MFLFSISFEESDNYELAKTELDIRLEELLEENSNGFGKSFFILPENDDANPVLRQQAFGMLVNLKSLLKRVLETGKKKHQIKADTDVDQIVHVFIATLEGSMMMSKLERNNQALTICIDFLRNVNKGILV
ncbi:TetR family transcriptional regulator C-terminal domain-containing protein [Nonlabens sp.]|uniref:TetR family transcriptional regulator C-terminal domain-containing protein n=1 Tax=Nonlabens sp. TaxID=1888209 RepID=UPI003F69D111